MIKLTHNVIESWGDYTVLFFLRVLDSPIGKISLDLLTRSLVISIVSDTSVCDLCHLVSPKVIGWIRSVPSVGFCVPITL